MHTGAEAPLFADSATRYPIIAFSHGLAGSPLSDDHFVVLSWLASYGYVVVAPFHGDPRFTNLQIDNFRDVVAVLSNQSDAIAMQALRPLAVTAALDLVLVHPQWRDHVDAGQIGGFGASLGRRNHAAAGWRGAHHLARPVVDPDRHRPADQSGGQAYVPYFGQPLLPAFGRDQSGLDAVTLPFLGIAGTADTTAPLDVTRQGMRRLAGPRQLVVLDSLEHGFDPASAGDVLSWSLTFLNAQVRGLPGAGAQLTTMTSVAGGGDDRLVMPLARGDAP